MSSRTRLDVRRMLLARGWVEPEFGLLRKGRAALAYDGDGSDA